LYCIIVVYVRAPSVPPNTQHRMAGHPTMNWQDVQESRHALI